MIESILNNININFVKNWFTQYNGNLYFCSIFFIVIILFLVKGKTYKKYISVYTIFLFFTVFNPLLAYIVFDFFGVSDEYYRFFWLLPINIIVAYFFIQITNSAKTRISKIGICLICLCLIFLFGKPVKKVSEIIDIPDNLYKVSDEVLEISEFIHAASDDNTPHVAAAHDLLMVLRQYDPSLQLTLNRDYALCWLGSPGFQYLASSDYYKPQGAIMDVIYGGYTAEPESFLTGISSTQTQYLVYSKSVSIQEYLVSLGLKYVAETKNYIIYKK